MILLLALVSSLQDTPIDHCIEQLHSEKPEVRETAAKQLRKFGPAAQRALEIAVKSSDWEVVQRAQGILKHINSDLAQSEFSKLRGRMEEAKTIRVHFEGLSDAADGDERSRRGFRGYWLIGRGGKARGVCSIKTSIDDSHHGCFVFLSDGARTAGGYQFNPDKPVATPTNFQNDLIHGLATLGTIHSTMIFLREPIDPKEPRLPCAPSKLTSGFQLLETKESVVKELIYTLHSEPDDGTVGPPSLKCNLWYDSVSRVPRKRTVTLFDYRTGAPESIISETYTEFSYDKEIPEEEFKF